MRYMEKKMSLFDAPKEYCLAHCISACAEMGAVIAVQFDKIYSNTSTFDDNNKGMKNYLQSKKTHVGTAEFYSPKNESLHDVFNLITKKKYWNKSTYGDLRESINDMKSQMLNLNIKHLAIPLIGCGLDGLNWPNVRHIVKDVFSKTDIEIIVCFNAKSHYIYMEDCENQQHC